MHNTKNGYIHVIFVGLYEIAKNIMLYHDIPLQEIA
jgi:hypothetical protein